MKPENTALDPADRRVDSVRSLADDGRRTLVAIGNFDGVHAGHRAVLRTARSDAQARGLALAVLTFHPHPAEVLGRGRQAVLTTIERKVELLCRLDPDLRVVVEPFTLALAATSPREFAEELLVRALRAKIVVVGQNFRFGHERKGDLAMLESLGKELGFEARAEPLVHDAVGPFSSSRIREHIAAGDVARAEELLGRPHSLCGVVVRGDGRGRTVGVPTANLGSIAETLPAHGVYSCLVDLVSDAGKGKRLATGVANVGNRPTVAAGFSVEVHLHDFDGDLYDRRLRIHLVDRIRPEQKFASLDALVAQIRADIETARTQTASRLPDPSAGGAWH
jgi:riboflavin kinase / FMN adenylyltransferase